MANESSTDDLSVNPVYMEQPRRDAGGLGHVTSREISFVEREPYFEQQNTGARVSSLISEVRHSGMRKQMEREQFGEGRKPSMSDVASQMVTAYNEEQRKAQNYRILGAVVFVLLAISIVANLGTSWYAVVANKETKTETVSAVPDSLAVNGSNTTTHKVLTDLDGHPLRTDRSLDRMKISSELPDEHWANLKEIHIVGTGGAIHFDVLGWARFSGEKSRCGTVVVVYTIAGQVQFDGTAMTFSNDVAGAFSRAGFPVSSRRHGRQAGDASGYTLTGIQEVFGAFNFVAQLDTSSLTCGDDKPNVTNNPFAGDVNDFYLVESHLYSCGDDGRPECPDNTDIQDILGVSYYKRTKHIRARRLGGNWIFVARTIIPEAEFASKETGSRANVLVELSNGTHVSSYTEYSFTDRVGAGPLFDDDEKQLQCFWNRTVEKAAHPLFTRSDSDGIGALDFSMEFRGYDVVNGEYVRHYVLTANNQSILEGENITTGGETVQVNMFESYEKNRLYSLGIFAPLKYTTYDDIVINPDPSVLQEDNMPALPSSEFEVADWLKTFTCPGGTGDYSVMHSNYELSDAIADEWEVPDVAKYNSIFPYTDEAANNDRLTRAFALSTQQAEFLRLNNSGFDGNDRHRRDVGEYDAEEDGLPEEGFSVLVDVPDDMAHSLASHIEKGTDFESHDMCTAKETCLSLFGNVSSACCETPASCAGCVGLLNVHREASSTEVAEIAENRRSRRRVGVSFTLSCDDPSSKSGRLWSGSPFRYYLDICYEKKTNWITRLHSGCRSGCRNCRYISFFKRHIQQCPSYSYSPISLEGGIEVNECFPGVCGNPKVYVEGKLWVELSLLHLLDSGAGGEIKFGVKVKILGKTIDVNVYGGLFFYVATATLKIYAGRGIGCCGISGDVKAYLTWTPALPQPRPPTGFGVEAEGCIGFKPFRVCAGVDIPIGI